MRKSLVCLAALASGCLSPAPAPTVRWFAPPSPSIEHAEVANPIALRMAGVRAAPHIGDRMLLRTSDVEFYPDEVDRWIASPKQFAEQAIAAALFDSGRCVESSSAPELRVGLIAFEAVLSASPSAVVEFDVTLVHDDITQRSTIRHSVELQDSAPESIARGIGSALGLCAGAIADWVERSTGR